MTYVNDLLNIPDSIVLRLAKVELVEGKATYICEAIENVCPNPKQIERLQYWIESMLEGHRTLTAWIYAKEVELNLPPRSHSNFFFAVQRHRLEWLEQLIKICEDEGA